MPDEQEMTKHKTDRLGRPTNPTLRKLEEELEVLAGIYRTARRNDDGGAAETYIKEYQETLERMYELGWDGFLDMMSLIPDEYMPKRYLSENPSTDYFGSNPQQFDGISVRRKSELETQGDQAHWFIRIFRKLWN